MSRRFLVTGGSQGIGAAIVHAAREAGHQVVFTGRNQGHIDATAKATGAEGIKADVSNDGDNERIVEHCVRHMRGIDVLINNAAFGYSAEIGSIASSNGSAITVPRPRKKVRRGIGGVFIV